jgi:hypothetical protein
MRRSPSLLTLNHFLSHSIATSLSPSSRLDASPSHLLASDLPDPDSDDLEPPAAGDLSSLRLSLLPLPISPLDLGDYVSSLSPSVPPLPLAILANQVLSSLDFGWSSSSPAPSSGCADKTLTLTLTLLFCLLPSISFFH